MNSTNSGTQHTDTEIVRQFISLVQSEHRNDGENAWLIDNFENVDEAKLDGAIREWRDRAVAVYLAQIAKAERLARRMAS
jgi:hypothetical protein